MTSTIIFEKATQDVIAERSRQVAIGYDQAGDDNYADSEVLPDLAKFCYIHGNTNLGFWPFKEEVFKDKGKRQNYVRAAALLIAEIERIDRAEAAEKQAKEPK